MKRGNRPKGPRGGKGLPGTRTEGGNDDGDTKLREHLNETRSDSDSGEAEAGDGAYVALSSHRSGVASRGVPTYAKRRCERHRRTDSGRVRGASGGEPPLA